MTIEGKGYSIDGVNNACVFKINNNMILKDIVFKNTLTNNSGGVLNIKSANVKIINCTFINNRANNSGGSIFLTDSSNITISDCTFDGNIVQGLYAEGGAIYANSSSNVIVENSNFFNNTADAGELLTV